MLRLLGYDNEVRNSAGSSNKAQTAHYSFASLQTAKQLEVRNFNIAAAVSFVQSTILIATIGADNPYYFSVFMSL